MDEYRLQFELLAASLIDVPDPIQEGNFINGLKAEIRAEVRMAQPKGLGRIMDLAKRVEERNEMLRRPKGQNAQYGQQMILGVNANFRVNNPNTWSKAAIPTDRNPSTRSDSSYRRLTEAELLEKREKGLCYRCDEKFGPRHVCKRKELQVLLDEDVEEEEKWVEAHNSKEEPPEIGEMVEISLNSVVGLTTLRTMKIKGCACGHEVIVLVDCRATHNFISTKLVEKLGLGIENTKGYGVVTGTRLSVPGRGVCKGVVLSLPELEVVEEFLPLELGSSDVILGMQWLGTLGGMHVN